MPLRIHEAEPELGRHRAIVSRLKVAGVLHHAQQIARSHGITLERMLSRRQFPSAVRARHRCWMFLRHTLSMSFNELAELFDVDHKAVSYGVRRQEEAARSLRAELGQVER